MMKKLRLITLIIFQFACLITFGQYDLGELLNLQFEIQSVNLKQRTEYIVDKNGHKIVTHIERFDNDGKCYEERFLDNKKLVKHITYEYSSLSNKYVRTILKGNNSTVDEYLDGILIETRINDSVKIVYKYDSLHRIILKEKSVKIFDDSIISITTYSYNPNISYVRKQTANSKTNELVPVFSIINSKNSRGFLSTYEYYSFSKNDSSLYEQRNYTYSNDELTIIEYLTQKGFGKTDTTVDYLYYNQGGFLDSLKTNWGNNIRTSIWERNEIGDLVKYSSKINGTVSISEEYLYDDKRNIIEKIITQPDSICSYYYLNLYR